MRYEFAKLHQRLKTTTIYVTHDQVEAMTLADRIAILDRGQIQQIGTAEDLYERPASLFVAGFIGSPQMNFIAARLASPAAAAVVVELPGGHKLKAAVDTGAATKGETVTLGIRPEHLVVSSEAGAIVATVTLIEWLGNVRFAYLTTDFTDDPLVMQLQPEQSLAEGQTVSVSARPGDCHLFDSTGEAFPRASGTSGSLAA
jgi:ABC-type sugar transport system ATPase subunit